MPENNNDIKPQDNNFANIAVPEIGRVAPIVKEEKKSKKSLIAVIVSIAFVILLGVVLVIVLSKSEPNNNQKNPVQTIEQENEPKKVSYTITRNSVDNFDIAFLKLENNKNNMIYSPLSIKYALGMLMQGSAGETLNQINNVLGQYQFRKITNNKYMSFANALFIKNSFKNSVDTEYVNKLKNNFDADVKYDNFQKPDNVNKYVSEKTFKLINNIVNDIKDSDYIILNALAINMRWVNRIQPDYNESDKNPDSSFLACYPHMKYCNGVGYLNEVDFHELSFNNDPVAKQSVEVMAVINNYDIVSALGKEKIKKIVTDDYNKWVKKGAENACEECDDEGQNCKKDTKFDFNKYFKELSANYKKIGSSTDFEFFVDDNVKVFKKDLKKYGETTLEYLAIMPQVDTLEDYINKITASDITTLMRKLKSIKLENFKQGVITEVTGYIPLFKFDYELKLVEDLNKMGITDVFDPEKANLSNLTSNNSYINNALHKANIDFSNDGIKAGAVTAESGRGGGDCGYDYEFVPPVETIDLTFDKPFIFMILDKDTEEVWFTGRVYEPSNYKAYYDIYLELHPEEAEELDEE